MRSSQEKMDIMYQEYGRLDGAICRNCEHLEAHVNADCTRVWYKCRMFGVSSGPGTDWRCGSEACGAFRIDPKDAKKRKLYGEVYRRCKGLRKKKPELQVEGQTSMNL